MVKTITLVNKKTGRTVTLEKKEQPILHHIPPGIKIDPADQIYLVKNPAKRTNANLI